MDLIGATEHSVDIRLSNRELKVLAELLNGIQDWNDHTVHRQLCIEFKAIYEAEDPTGFLSMPDPPGTTRMNIIREKLDSLKPPN